MKKTIITFVIALFTGFCATSQTKFDLPQDIKLKTESDYVKYENDIVSATKWLEETDLDKETDKRKQIDAFVINWVSGTPTITVEMNSSIMKLYGKNNELLVLYMGSYSSYFIENKNADKTSAIKAGLVSMINVYKKGISIKKNKEMEKVIEALDQNKLDEYITKNFG
ncbi:hypothetical protein HNP37_001926 [Flavobacterium nitrogenifigens]|uniref:Uncharacterized protein n=2 Tax=Flavobacterium TaxID=237 RepID=A0A7W7IWR1_9FLAO|nr:MULTISPECIES: hypothetical protein [Flavobacterium]MBB4801865.1 hypothetical protein [Flavobacterium nitrogenifigens]MBB6386823.1 hypothetical protein [Flavobacterium notoginsengisoli]